LRLAEGYRFASVALRAFPVLYAKDVELVAAIYSGLASHSTPACPPRTAAQAS
jgi:hypothetical protein